MGRTVFLLISVVLVAYYIYIPLPDAIEEPWKVVLESTFLKIVMDLASFGERLGINHSMETLQLLMRFQDAPPTSDKNVTVMETTFDSVHVRIYIPKRKSAMRRRGLFYIHGGGWCLGSAGSFMYDTLSRRTAHKLDAVVVSTDYGLAPKYHFPRQFEDVYRSLRWFLQEDILEKYGVDPRRVGVSGDSAGGNLAAAVTQQLLQDPDVKIKLKVQALIYPALQALDTNLPSQQEGSHYPLLTRSLMVRFWSEYFTTDQDLKKAMLLNQHVPTEFSHLLQFVNWSSLLPERYKKGHFYKNPTPGNSELVQKYPGFVDVKACPLLANDNILHHLPLTYIITCQYDVLRDDGLMYVQRLRNVGAHVTHHHFEDGFHGAFSLPGLKITNRMQNQYFSWLIKNL
ncbi:arylacetamide deacetylase isoform X2 [Apodemus sylvaticus]|uniref:arylacetamide deacetylase isoform X2 n=1 Tax=Apodemus sylvaticus TaxID=10129 RepID=UPI002244BFEF|nr:arylacetamide deacetylase isoform X2 [Apodemus sylvaticus]